MYTCMYLLKLLRKRNSSRLLIINSVNFLYSVRNECLCILVVCFLCILVARGFYEVCMRPVQNEIQE